MGARLSRSANTVAPPVERTAATYKVNKPITTLKNLIVLLGGGSIGVITWVAIYVFDGPLYTGI